MVTLRRHAAYLYKGKDFYLDEKELQAKTGLMPDKAQAVKGTMAWRILESHNISGSMDKLQIKFDALASHDITFVGIIQTARCSGMEGFPIPYVLTNCHNSLCAVGGTINEDDHVFGLSACKKYGGIFVPPHQAVIHQYMREQFAGGGRMILGSDSHTRYGALGTMAIGEGGPELVKQLLERTYDIDYPEVVAVHLTGKPQIGVGPQDVALALVGAVFAGGVVKNKVLEFVGEGVRNLSADYRIGIDVMTTETACLSSIWETDGTIRDYLTIHGRAEDYRELYPSELAYYDDVIEIDLSSVVPMIAMPFHPGNAYPIEEVNRNSREILAKVESDARQLLGDAAANYSLSGKLEDGRLTVQQAVIAGCAGGTFENLCDVADMLDGHSTGFDKLALSIYPSSQPVFLELVKNGSAAKMMTAGATVRTAFCGPCFGAGDVPFHDALSIRHTTRNFPNREGSKPSDGQLASVALMDARSIAATVLNGGKLTAATELDLHYTSPAYYFDASVYENRCYDGLGRANPNEELILGPNITDWPAMQPLSEHLILQFAAAIDDPVTTTDELIPSGETSSLRSNPLKLAEFTLSRKDPAYVGRAKAVQALETARLQGKNPAESDSAYCAALSSIRRISGYGALGQDGLGIGSVIYAACPGDGSAREQAVSCQKVLGTFANVAREYATKRYRSNLINWGLLPLLLPDDSISFSVGDFLFLPDIRKAVAVGAEKIEAFLIHDDDAARKISLHMAPLTDDEKQIILAGCLMNFYRDR